MTNKLTFFIVFFMVLVVSRSAIGTPSWWNQTFNLSDGLVAYYPMNETGHLISAGSSDGIIRNIQQTGTVPSVKGIIGNGRGAFSDANYFRNNTFLALSQTGNYSFNVWVNQTAETSSAFDTLFHSSNGAGYLKNFYAIHNDVNKVYIEMNKDGSVYSIDEAGLFPDVGAWTMLTFVHSENKTFHAYKNGVMIGTQTDGSAAATTSTNLEIGNVLDSGGYAADLVLMDELGIWYKVLTPEEITALYNSGAGLAYELAPAGEPCTPDWNCSGYADCLANDTQLCNNVTDLNVCGEAYDGDYSEFEPGVCDYCTPSWNCSGYADCLVNDTQLCNTVEDFNTCGEGYAGDYSEFEPGVCDYCTPSWECSEFGSCVINISACLNVTDLNICGEEFTGNLTSYDVACHPALNLLDLSSISGVMLMFVLVVMWLGSILIGSLLGNPAFIMLGAFIGIILGFLMTQINYIIPIGMVLINGFMIYFTFVNS